MHPASLSVRSSAPSSKELVSEIDQSIMETVASDPILRVTFTACVHSNLAVSQRRFLSGQGSAMAKDVANLYLGQVSRHK